MDIAKELATMCVASMVKSAADPRAIRDQFEASADREGLERRHAGRLNDLYTSRAADEDQSLGGYASTGLSRALLPIPQTGTEALVRGGIMAGTGALGYHVGQQMGGPMSDGSAAVKSLFSGSKPSMQKVVSSIAGSTGANKDSINAFNSAAAVAKPEDLKAAFNPSKRLFTGSELKGRLKNIGRIRSVDDAKKHVGNLFTLPDKKTSAGGQALIDLARQHLGNTAPKILRQETKLNLGQAKDLPKSRMPGLIGAGLGLGAGALATGIPMAARALWQKHQGGEAAVRARDDRDEANSKADEQSQKREQLLASLRAGGLKKASDNNFDEASMIALLRKVS